MKHILLIDDDVFIRDLVGTKLNNAKYTTAVAADSVEGDKMISTQLPDLILLDLDLPGEPGLEMLRRLKVSPETAHIPVVVFSNNDDPQVKQDIREAGAVDFYLKISIDMAELEKKVDAILV